MQISLRSHMIAGTAAVVGAGAIAMTPVTAAPLSLPSVHVPTIAQVTLAGFDSPLSELLSTAILASSYLTDGFQDPTNPASWPFSGIANGTGFVGSLAWPAALGTPEAGGYSSVGLIPQIIDDALPIISQLGYNGSSYINAALTGLGGAGYILSEGVWNAAGDFLTLDIAGGINTLRTAISSAGQLALSSLGFVVANVVNRAAAVGEYLISEIPVLIGATVGQVRVLAQALIKPITDVFAAFGQPNPVQGVWNAVVDGLLGPSGIPGTVLNLTIGAGVQTGPIAANTPAELVTAIEDNFVPSIRTEVQAAVKGVAGALATEVGSAATARAGASTLSARVAAANEAPAVEVPAVAEAKVEAVTGSDASEAPAPVVAASDNSSASEAPAPKKTKRAERGATSRGAAKAAAS